MLSEDCIPREYTQLACRCRIIDTESNGGHELKLNRLGLVSIGTIIGVIASGSIATTAIAAPALTSASATFTLTSVAGAATKQTVTSSAQTLLQKNLSQSGIGIVTVGKNHAVADTALIAYGALWAATSQFVDLSWEAVPGVTKYVIEKDGVSLGETTALSYRDTNVEPGDKPAYQVQSVNPEGDPTFEGRTWGLVASVPAAKQTDETAVESAALSAAAAAASYATSTVQWTTFIPDAYVNSPSTGCDYGTAYKYGGDNRSWQPSGYPYRTLLEGKITWSSQAFSSSKGIGTTHVYKKSDGSLVAQATASSSGLSASKLGSTSTTADLRFNVNATNPYCHNGAIDGSMTIHITRAGSYSITSGNFRQMPNTEIYISNGSSWTTIIRSAAASSYCLIGAVFCDLITLTGRTGSY